MTTELAHLCIIGKNIQYSTECGRAGWLSKLKERFNVTTLKHNCVRSNPQTVLSRPTQLLLPFLRRTACSHKTNAMHECGEHLCEKRSLGCTDSSPVIFQRHFLHRNRTSRTGEPVVTGCCHRRTAWYLASSIIVGSIELRAWCIK